MNPDKPHDPTEQQAEDANVIGSDAAHGGGRDPVIDDLIEQSRILTGSRMIPSVGQLTDGHRQQVRDALEGFIERTKKPLAMVAAGIRIGESTLSEWRHGTYRGDVDKIARQVNRWIERESQRLQAERPTDYVPTRVAETMYAIIADADRRNMMAAIVAPSGAGKSLVLEAYAKDTRGGYLDCREATRSTREFVRQLLGSVDQQMPKGASLARLLGQLLGYLREGRKRTVLLLDEAQHLTPDQLAMVRTIHDRAEVPIVMAGTAEILMAIDDRSNGRGQFASRCLFFNLSTQFDVIGDNGGGGNNASGKPQVLFTLDEVRQFFDSKRMRFDADALDLLWKLANLQTWGGLRLAYRIAEVPAAKIGEGIITYAMVFAVVRKLYTGPRFTLIETGIADFERAVTRKGRVA